MARGGRRPGAGRKPLSPHERWLRGGGWHPSGDLKVVGLDYEPARPITNPAPDAVPLPDHLEATGQRWFREINAGWRLDARHRQLVELHSDLLDEYAACRTSIKKFGMLVKNTAGTGPRRHPLLPVLHACRRDFLSVLAALDLDGDDPADTR